MKNDYPTEETLQAIKNWQPGDYGNLLAFVQAAISDYGRFWHDEADVDGSIRIATGGWSGNEEIISAMQDNHIFWATCWQSSHRGGLFVFRLPT